MGRRKSGSGRLTGEALLKKVAELKDLSKEEKARQCGYFTITKNGVERVNVMKFSNALLDEVGFELDGKSGPNGGGRSASYRITVQQNGNLLIGRAYTKKMNLKPGDEFEISLGRKHIQLKQVGGDDGDNDDSDNIDDE